MVRQNVNKELFHCGKPVAICDQIPRFARNDKKVLPSLTLSAQLVIPSAAWYLLGAFLSTSRPPQFTSSQILPFASVPTAECGPPAAVSRRSIARAAARSPPFSIGSPNARPAANSGRGL